MNIPDIKHLSKESKDAIALMAIQGMNYIIPLVTIPYLIATLGPTGYGYIGFSLAYVSYFSLIVEFGFGLGATQRMIYGQSIGPATSARIFTATILAKIFLFILILVPYFLIPIVIQPIRRYAISIYCMFPIIIGQTITLGWFFQSIGKIKIVALSTGLSRLLILPLLFIFVKSSTDYIEAALIQSVAVLASGIFTIVYLASKKNLIFRKVTIDQIKTELSESYPLFLSGVATSIYTQLFTIILGILSSPSIVGVYSASERIIRVFCVSIFTPLSQAFFPKIANLAIVNRNAAILLTRKILIFLWFVMGMVGILTLILAPTISSIIGKNNYSGMTTLLRIMAFLPLVISTGGILGQSGLIAMGNSKTKKDFRNTYFFAGIIALILISILAPLLKDIGASIAMTATEVFVTLLMLYYVIKNKNQEIAT